MTMTGTQDTFTDNLWQWQGLWILQLASSGEERTLDTSSDLTGNDRDSGYNY